MLRGLTSTDHTSLLGRLLRLPLKFVPARMVVRIASGTNKGLRWICGSSIQRCWFGTYEFEKQDFVARIVKPGMTVWDIGANVGFYTLAFARLVGPKGKVLAFEPMAENVTYLLQHVHLNDLQNVQVLQLALNDASDLLGFTATRKSSQGALTTREHPYLVPTMRASEIAALFPEAKPGLLKIDVEGAESAVLTGARPVLETFEPDILLALHGVEQEERCFRILRDLDYRLFYLDGRELSVGGRLSSDEIFATRKGVVPAA